MTAGVENDKGAGSMWTAKRDKKSGKDYYVNTVSGKRTWKKPTVLKTGAAPRRASSLRKGPSQRQSQQRRRSSVSMQAAPGEDVDAEFKALQALAKQRKSQRRSTATLG